MKVSGVTIVKNAIKLDYPFIESIKSVLPLVDEMIVSIGDGDDNTEEMVLKINSTKIKIVHSVWNKKLNEGGSVLADETNKAMQYVSKDSDWIFYIQADEVVHEKYYNTITKAMNSFKNNLNVQGLLFKYIHFYGNYNYIGDSRKWYKNEIRIIRNDLVISSYRDAQGFRRENKKLKVKLIDAFIYHYGWVRHPHATAQKMATFNLFWNGNPYIENEIEQNELFDYMANVDSVAHYKGTHPAIMNERINALNWQIEFDIKKKKFSLKDKFLYRFEKLTGYRLFDYKNYKII